VQQGKSDNCRRISLPILALFNLFFFLLFLLFFIFFSEKKTSILNLIPGTLCSARSGSYPDTNICKLQIKQKEINVVDYNLASHANPTHIATRASVKKVVTCSR
jgi:hypothetical protein